MEECVDTVLPSLGAFHILHPRHNAATVLAMLEGGPSSPFPSLVFLASHSRRA